MILTKLIYFRDLLREDVIQHVPCMEYSKYDKIHVNRRIFSALVYRNIFYLKKKSQMKKYCVDNHENRRKNLNSIRICKKKRSSTHM